MFTSCAPEAGLGHRQVKLVVRGDRIIACIEDPVVIEKIFTHLHEKGASAEAFRRPPSRTPPQAGLFD